MAVDKELEPVLIAFVKQNRLHFSTETFKDILSKVGSRPVSVVSLSNSKVEQKEQVFNEFLKYLKTLDINGNKSKTVWKSKSETDVKGIYLCPEPIIMKKSCQEVAVLLMEVNGCFVPKTATREDLMLFALSCVLSSTLIYNFENDFSEDIQEFLQLFREYGKGGTGTDLKDSYLNLVIMINNWKLGNRYPFGYHDTGTFPINGNKRVNYRTERLDSRVGPDKDLSKEEASKNKYFVDSFQKISFCLTPSDEDMQMIDQNIVKTSEILRETTVRLFHPSNLSIKYLGHQKFNGHQLVRLFEQISLLMSETDIPSETEDQFKVRVKTVAKEIVEKVVHKEKGLNGKQSGIDYEISQLVGLSLDGLTGAVRSTIGTN